MPKTSLLIPGISGCVVNERYIDRKEADAFQTWLNDESKPFAVVTGPAASGKTNFLVNAILKESYYEKRLVLFYSLGSYEPRRQTLMPSMAEFLTGIPSHDVEPINANVLHEMIADGRILLVLDGLDELARNHGEESVEQLDTELHRLLGSKTPKIAVACRDHIYERLQRGKALMSNPICQRISLGPLDARKLKRKLEESDACLELPEESDALTIMTKIPLFYSALSQDLGSVAAELGTISSKSAFWDMWLRLSSRSLGDRDSNAAVAEVLQELGTIAVEMLSKRTDYLSDEELGEYASRVEQYACTSYPVFVKEANNKWRFIHQAMREYTLASCMKIGLEELFAESVMTRTSSFDYESVEVYQDLKELLPGNSMDAIIDRLGKDLRAIKGKKKWNNLIRNYFEAVGMLGSNSKKRRHLAISQALTVLKDPLSGPNHRAYFLTKFNAARCLCRIHPTSPPIYCDHVSRYSWQENPCEYMLVFGYAVRGFHRRHHQAGRYPPEIFYKAPMHHDRQGEVTDQLLDVLEELVGCEELHPNGEFLKINASHALIRWLNMKGLCAKQNKRRVTKLLGSRKLNSMVKANLVLALYVNGGITDEQRSLLQNSKYPNGVTVDLRKLRALYTSR